MGYAFLIEPGQYYDFEDEASLIEKCKEWNLLSEKASKTKTFYYKGNGVNLSCSIVGYVDKMTAVIEFDNKQLHCIHPSYLKEMQASSYEVKPVEDAEKVQDSDAKIAEVESQHASEGLVGVPSYDDDDLVGALSYDDAPPWDETSPETEASLKIEVDSNKGESPQAQETSKGKTKKEKAPKLQLPEDKVKMTATVKEFTTVPNHFSDNDDEVVIYEAVAITESSTDIGEAWSSYSATLKKLELEIGDTITFEAKIAAKKLTKHPVAYKINNPSKLQKV